MVRLSGWVSHKQSEDFEKEGAQWGTKKIIKGEKQKIKMLGSHVWAIFGPCWRNR
jgi:hypothetical protein